MPTGLAALGHHHIGTAVHNEHRFLNRAHHRDEGHPGVTGETGHWRGITQSGCHHGGTGIKPRLHQLQWGHGCLRGWRGVGKAEFSAKRGQ